MLPGPQLVIACPTCKSLARVFTLLTGNTFRARWWTDGKRLAPMMPSQPRVTKCESCGSYFWVADAKVVGEVPEPFSCRRKKLPKRWAEAPWVKHLTEGQCFEALSSRAARNKGEEIHLRVLAWQAANDRARFRPEVLRELRRRVVKRLAALQDGPRGRSLELLLRRSIEDGLAALRNHPQGLTYLHLKVMKRRLTYDIKESVPRAPRKRSRRATQNLMRLVDLFDSGNNHERVMKAEALRELGGFDEAENLLAGGVPDDYAVLAAFLRELVAKKDTTVREILFA